MTLAAYDAQDRAEQILSLTTRLTELVRDETEALKSRRLDASSANWSEKERLAQAYRLEMAKIADDPTRLSGIDGATRQKLTAATKEFQDLLADHAQAVNAMKQISEGLVQAIAEELSTAQAAPKGYGASGTIQGGTQAKGVAVNAKA